MALGIRTVNQTSVRNVQAGNTVKLQDTQEVRALTRHFTENMAEAQIDILGPLPDGKSVLRITAKPINGDKVLKAHVEINLTGEELIEFMQQDVFYRNLATLKLSQFTGYIGEQKLMDFALNGTFHNRVFMKTAGRQKAQSFFEATGKQVVPDRVWGIQNGSGHGIDFLCEVQPYPPKPKYMTIDAKSTLRSRFGDYSTPNGPALSDKQSKPLENLIEHLQAATADFRRNNSYNLSREEFQAFSEILEDLEDSSAILSAYKANIGLINGFNLASNKKYNHMIVLSEI